MIRRQRFRFVCAVMGIFMLTLSLILNLVFYHVARDMARISIQTMELLAENPAQQYRPGEDLRELHLPYFALQISNQGEILEQSGDFFDLSDESLIRKMIHAAMEEPAQTGKLKEYGLRYLIRETPGGYSLVFTDATMEARAIRSLFARCVLIFLVATALFLGVTVLLSGWAVRPIEQAWQKQKQFVADVSHELKSPMAVIMANAELVGSDGIGESERKKSAEYILSTGYRMRSLVESMLELTRMECELPTVQFSRLDFSQLVTDAALSFQLLYEEKGIILETAVAEGIFLRGSSQHLYQLLDVLLDNGLKYSAPGGPVRVSLEKTGRSCLLCVSSPGEPLSGTDCEQIFRRFYRTDQTKHENGSYGLGLSIAAAVVNTHKGKIWAQSEAGRNTFCVRLPRSEQRRG